MAPQPALCDWLLVLAYCIGDLVPPEMGIIHNCHWSPWTGRYRFQGRHRYPIGQRTADGSGTRGLVALWSDPIDADVQPREVGATDPWEVDETQQYSDRHCRKRDDRFPHVAPPHCRYDGRTPGKVSAGFASYRLFR